MKGRSYVYRHIRLDTNEVFYIGIGNTEIKYIGSNLKSRYKRAYSQDNRNKWWNHIVEKTTFKVEILVDEITREEAIELEIFLIQEYGKKNLCNITDGGEGKIGGNPNGIDHWNYGKKHSITTRLKISNSHKGKKHSEETKLKLKQAHIGRNYPKCKEDTKLKISKAHKGLKKGGANPSAKIIINLDTGIYYECGKDAAESLNLNYSTFMDRLNGRSKKKINMKYA
jgi:hypothetical protein